MTSFAKSWNSGPNARAVMAICCIWRTVAIEGFDDANRSNCCCMPLMASPVAPDNSFPAFWVATIAESKPFLRFSMSAPITMFKD